MSLLRIAHSESSVHLGGQELRILDQRCLERTHGHQVFLFARLESAISREDRFLDQMRGISAKREHIPSDL